MHGNLCEKNKCNINNQLNSTLIKKILDFFYSFMIFWEVDQIFTWKENQRYGINNIPFFFSILRMGSNIYMKEKSYMIQIQILNEQNI